MGPVKENHELGPEGRELKRRALRFCRMQPRRLETGIPFLEGREDRAPRAEHLAELAVALNDLDLAREIDLAAERTSAEARVLEQIGDADGLRRLIELTGAIDDRTLHGETVRGLIEAKLGPEWLRLLIEPVGRVHDWELRDRLWGRLAESLVDPDLAYRILEDKTRLGPLSEIAGRTGRVDLARDTLNLARKLGGQELLLAPFWAAPQVGDESLLRRCLGLTVTLDDIELRIAALDLLGKCDFRNEPSRRAYRLVQSLPEFEPDEDDDGLWEGSRDIPLAHLALRHKSVTLARRVNGKLFRDFPLATISIAESNLELTAEISDPETRTRAQTSIALETGNQDLLDRILARLTGDPEMEQEWFDAAVAKLTLLRRHGSPQLSLLPVS